MASFRQYRRADHNHPHYCPSCKNSLVTVDHGNAPVVELECETTDCKIVRCYCNGTYDQYTVTANELFRCAADILSYLDSDNAILTTAQTPNELGAIVRTAIDDYEFVERKTEDTVEHLFTLFARLEWTLTERNPDVLYQSRETSERVVPFGQVYVPASEVLVYTLIGDEFSENDALLQYPVSFATYLDESAVQPYNSQFKTQVEEYFE